jgi:hypothetical protein
MRTRIHVDAAFIRGIGCVVHINDTFPLLLVAVIACIVQMIIEFDIDSI